MTAKITGILVLIIWFFWSFIFGIFHLSFAQPEYTKNVRWTWIVLVPFAISLLWIKKWRNEKRASIISVLVIVGSFLLVLFLNFLHSVCAESYSEPLLTHKKSKKTIRIRDFGCGAWDSDPSKSIVIVSDFGGILYHYTPVDTNEIDMSNWMKN